MSPLSPLKSYFPSNLRQSGDKLHQTRLLRKQLVCGEVLNALEAPHKRKLTRVSIVLGPDQRMEVVTEVALNVCQVTEQSAKARFLTQ